MIELRKAVYAALAEQFGDKVYYYTPPVDVPLPYVQYWLTGFERDPEGGFGEDRRRGVLLVRAVSKDAGEAASTYWQAHDLLDGHVLNANPWHMVQPLRWERQTDDIPADQLADNQLVYYEGGQFAVVISR